MKVLFEYNDSAFRSDHSLVFDTIVYRLPLKTLRQVLIIDNYLLVCMKHDSPVEWLNDGNIKHRKIYVKESWIMASGVWCFDLKGNYLWKAPEVVDRNHPNIQGEDLTLNFHGSVYVKFRCDQQINHIIGNTSHGHIVTIAIDTGKVISIIQGK